MEEGGREGRGGWREEGKSVLGDQQRLVGVGGIE